MSKIVAIITEYNPFHNGHKYQIDKIRQEMPDATIISIMSGNVVQRGDFAFTDKYTRAEMAINCGVDAVFELPFPYACSTAEIFATVGVKIADKLGADYLYFGIEEDSIQNIEKIADTINSSEFNEEITKILSKEKISYPLAREKALLTFGLSLSKCSNDILAIEYVRAIKENNLRIQYKAIKRVGARYKDNQICNVMSASAIRKYFYENKELLSIPQKAKKVLDLAVVNGNINNVNLSNIVLLSNVILCSSNELENLFDVANGMGNYIAECARKCQSPESFTENLSSKNYTTSRLKRATIYSLFNVTRIDKTPGFTVLLGANNNGKKIISQNRKKESITIITKHSDAKKLNQQDLEIYEKMLKVDSMYALLMITPSQPSLAYKKVPYIE